MELWSFKFLLCECVWEQQCTHYLVPSWLSEPLHKFKWGSQGCRLIKQSADGNKHVRWTRREQIIPIKSFNYPLTRRQLEPKNCPKNNRLRPPAHPWAQWQPNVALQYWGKREIEREERRRSMWGLLKMEENQEVKVRHKRRETECGRKKTTDSYWRTSRERRGNGSKLTGCLRQTELAALLLLSEFLSLCRLLTATKPQPAW